MEHAQTLMNHQLVVCKGRGFCEESLIEQNLPWFRHGLWLWLVSFHCSRTVFWEQTFHCLLILTLS